MPDNYITLSQLTKTTKGLVNKINAEAIVTNTNIGDLADLNTTAKNNLVAAINEAVSSGTQYDDTVLAGRVTALENAGYITEYIETDPTVPAWAKAENKPTYTAAEVGALPDTYTAPVSSVNGQTGAVNLTIPAAQVQSDWNATTGMGVILNKPTIPTVPTNISAFTNDAGYLTSFTEEDPTVPAWAKAASKPTYTAAEVGALPDTTVIPTKTSNLTNDSGFITSADIPDTSTFMVKGTDYVTAGQVSGATLGTKATAEGYNTTASGDYSHAEGQSTTASKYHAHAEGSSTEASGNASHAEGTSTIASGNYSHAEGSAIEASGDSSHAEGFDTTASGSSSHAEGSSTTASAPSSHTEGSGTTANGSSSHAEGDFTTASGSHSHAEGHSTMASGQGSHAEGYYTIAQRKSQHVFGEWNSADTTGTVDTRGTYVEIVGNGVNTTKRSNARTLDWSGNEVLAGKLTVGVAPTADMDVATKQYVDTAIGNVNSFNVSVVSTLPAAGDVHTIYFVQQASPSTAHDEYMYINNSWELIGSTQIDLSNYLQTTDIADWAKAATKPTYTASEVGALPSTYTAPVTSVNGQTGAVTLSIPAAQVQSDWNATTGMGVILNKPTIPAATTVTNTLASGTLIATINGTNIYAPAYTDADGVSY